MARAVRSRQAKRDVKGIWKHIAADNPSAADRMLDRISGTITMLARNPLLGERRPDLAPDLRAFVVGNYIVFYRPTKGGIEVVRVLHGARDIRSQF